MEKQIKKKTIFLSHSSKDEELAKSLYNLLNLYIQDNKLQNKYDIFYSPISLNTFEKYSNDWKEKIKIAAKGCAKFVVLWTPNSIKNRWVNYELGIATANSKNKEFWAVGIKGIDFGLIIPSLIQTVYLDSSALIKNFLSGILKVSIDNVNDWSSANINIINRIITIAETKCVFISGSKHDSPKWSSKRVHDFIQRLSLGLYECGFKLASYPLVPEVGEVVAKCIVPKDANKYEIAGLYKFDDDRENFLQICGCNVNLENWAKTLSKFRQIYLQGKNYLVIVGGGTYTEIEYYEAKKRDDIEIFPIPCFGGKGQELYELMKADNSLSKLKHPCTKCYGKKTSDGPCLYINEFVKRFQKHITITFDDVE